MSRTKCPKCGCRLVIAASLREFDWNAVHANTGRGAIFDHDLAVQMFTEGATVASIARHFNVAWDSVGDVLKRRGLK